jgi:hypothetical protein
LIDTSLEQLGNGFIYDAGTEAVLVNLNLVGNVSILYGGSTYKDPAEPIRPPIKMAEVKDVRIDCAGWGLGSYTPAAGLTSFLDVNRLFGVFEIGHFQQLKTELDAVGAKVFHVRNNNGRIEVFDAGLHGRVVPCHSASTLTAQTLACLISLNTAFPYAAGYDLAGVVSNTVVGGAVSNPLGEQVIIYDRHNQHAVQTNAASYAAGQTMVPDTAAYTKVAVVGAAPRPSVGYGIYGTVASGTTLVRVNVK